MQEKINKVLNKVLEYNSSDIRTINNLMRVYSFARAIADLENKDERTKYIVSLAAILHNIGTKRSLEVYGSDADKYLELEGPGVAEEILNEFEVEEKVKKRVLYYIKNRKNYKENDGDDFQILFEAELLVYLYEDNMERHHAKAARNKYFETEAGINFMNKMYID